MRHFSSSHRSSFFYYLLPVVSFAILNSCEKEMKTGTNAQTSNTDRVAGTNSLESAAIDTTGLVAWFDFNGGSLLDKSSYHNKIIFNNAQPAADRNGVANNAYYFNGNGNYMRVKNSPSLNPTNGITLFAIVNIKDFYEGKCHDNRIINKGVYDGDPGYYDLDFADALYTDHASCEQAVDKAHQSFDGNWDATGATDSTEYVQTNHWYHIVYTYGSGKGKLYIDGKLVSLFKGKPAVSSSNYDVFFGTTNTIQTQYPYWLNGTIDQIGIFNIALNEAQVARLSNL